MENYKLLDGVGFSGNIFEQATVVVIVLSTLMVFVLLWRRGRLDMDQEPAETMMQTDDNDGRRLKR